MQGATVTRVSGLAVDADAERLRTLLASLPALRSIGGGFTVSGLTLLPHPGAAVAAAHDFLAGAARAIGCCSCLRRLDLLIVLDDKLADRVPGSFWQFLAEARALEGLKLTITSEVDDMHYASATASVSQVVAGLAGLSQLRALTLTLDNVCEDTEGSDTLPACVSRLVQLTFLSLKRVNCLRCAPGWARLPALKWLDFEDCGFAVEDGEAALPGMDALVSLTRLTLDECHGLSVLPASLWRLARLHSLHYWSWLSGEEPRELLVAGLPASAPCCGSMRSLLLSGHGLSAFPACVLALKRLALLDLCDNCFEQLPEDVSVLTALMTLRLGHSAGWGQIGGALDARALGGLGGFPNLCSLVFERCSVLLCPSFQAAAAHTRLKELELRTSYPACGPSCGAFLVFVVALLQQGRAGVLRLHGSVDQGEGLQDDQSFRVALQAVGFAPCEDDGARVAAEGEYSSDSD